MLFRNAVALELLVMICAALVLGLGSHPYGVPAMDLAIAFAAAGLGLQNAVVRNLAVPDLTTSVLTMTLTGVAADLRSRDVRVAARRMIAVAAMLIGALVGALLVRHSSPAIALIVVCALVAAVFVAAALANRSTAPWQSP